MKKRLMTIVAMALSCLGAFAQVSPTATTKVYDLDNFGDGIIDVFYTADQAGLKFPTQAMWEAAGYDMQTINFVRSHVKPQTIIDRSARLNQDAYEKRNLWLNLPIGIGKNQGGYPSSNFSDDTFSAWNYTNLFGAWNHGLFHNSAVVGDAAHKNGTDMMAGIKFFESWTEGSGASGWVAKVQEKDSKGYDGYKYVRPLVNACIYFGKDGINYNFEDTGYGNCTGFHAACYKYAAECGMKDFHVGIYTAQSNLTSANIASLLGTPTTGQCYDTFLNYAGSDFQTAQNIAKSVAAVKTAWGSYDKCEDVYQGAWIVSMARSWKNLNATSLNKYMGIVLWGEHSQSRFMSYNSGTDGLDFQENYQKLMDRFMSGGYRNPASHPAENNDAQWNDGLKGYQGISYYIPERSAIRQNLPFTTYFSIGNGDRYNYKGKKTLGAWYNLGQQDVMPTYRWLVYEAGTTTPVTDDGNTNNGVPYFTNRDSYIGGSCLKLTNKKAVDIILYRCELTVSGDSPKATLAQKCLSGSTDGKVKVIVKLKGQDKYKEVATFKSVKGTTWDEQTVSMTGLSNGDVIEYVGLRTTGSTDGLMVGELSLSDDSKKTPAGIKDDLLVTVVEECQKSLSVKLAWNLDAKEDKFGQVYNQDQNIDHFEIFYKDGAEGLVSEVGRTTAWSAYVGNLPMEDTTDPWVGVRAASVDGKTYSSVQWVHVTRADKSTLPEAISASGSYPSIILDNSSEGFDIALADRYVSKIKVSGSDADFTYTNNVGTPYTADIKAGISDANADKTNYIFASDNTIKVHQGQKVSMDVTIATADDGLQFCTAWGYADWDCSQGFNAAGDEWFWKGGESNSKAFNPIFGSRDNVKHTVTVPLNIPEDAVTGTSRVRLVFSDCWFPHPGATGSFAKGFAIDLPMEITGSNPGRNPEVDTHDSGVADDPLVDAIQSVSQDKNGVSQVVVKNGQISFQNVDKLWIYTADGRLVKFVNGNVSSLPTQGLNGTFLMKMQYGKIIRTRKLTF